MKIIHTGDVHIGSAFQNLPIEKASIRRTELLDGFANLCAYAKESGVSAVLIAGDLFDENKVARYIKKQVFALIEQASPVCFFYVSGNHDDEFDGGDSLPKNLYLFSQNTWQSYDLGEGVVVSGADSKRMSRAYFGELQLSSQAFNILLLHGDVQSENSKESIPLPLLSHKGIDYLALGHIHKPMLDCKPLDGRGKYRYCGCLEGRGFDEIGQRGFFLLEIKNKTVVQEKFLSFSKRQVLLLRVDISNCNSYFDVEKAVFEGLKSARAEDVVKVVLCGRIPVGLRKDLSLLSARVRSQYFYVKIEDESRIAYNAQDFINDVTERGEFVREVGRYALNDAQREEILEVGLKALAGEEIDL